MREELSAAHGTVLREGCAYFSSPGFSLITATHMAGSKETEGTVILRSRSSPRRSLLLPALAQAKADKTIPPAASTPNIPLTVLVVDDDRNQVEILTRFLSRRGMRALPAYGGQQCLEMVCQRSIDVIVLDVVIPGMGGL